MKIGIFPGSFKPPHLGHYQILEKMLNEKKKYDKIYIIISYRPRPLDQNLYEISNLPKESIYQVLKIYNKNLKVLNTKKEYIDHYKELLKTGKIPYIRADQSHDIWKLYIDNLNKKYGDKIKDTEVILKISYAPSPILNVSKIVESIKKKNTNDNIHLIKSIKNKMNSRFDFIKVKYPDVKVNVIKSNEPSIHSKLFRQSILNQNKKLIFNTFLPKDLTNQTKNKIWKILTENSKHGIKADA